MFETPTKYGIIVAVDGSAESDAAISWAAREASMRHEHVTLMHVVQPVALSWPVSPEQTTVAESMARTTSGVRIGFNRAGLVVGMGTPIVLRSSSMSTT